MTLPDTLTGSHLAALTDAYALMQAAHDTGKPRACWAHHRSVGGARTADQLVDRGLFDRRIDARPGDVETYRYRITRAGSAKLGKLHLIEEKDMTVQPDSLADLRFTPPAPADDLPATKPCPNCARTLRLKSDADGRFYECDGCALLEDVDAAPEEAAAAEGTPPEPAEPAAPTAPAFSDTIVRLANTLSAAGARMLAQIVDVVPVAPRDSNTRYLLEMRGLMKPVGKADDWTHVATESGKSVIAYYRSAEHSFLDTLLRTTPQDKPASLADEPVELHPVPTVATTGKERDEAVQERDAHKRELDAALAMLANVASLLADADGQVPDDIETAVRGLKIRAADAEQQAEALRGSYDRIAEETRSLRVENDDLRTDKRSLELAVAATSGADSQLEVEFRFGIHAPDLRALFLAGWTAEHYHVADGKVDVILRREGKKAARAGKRGARTVDNVAVPTAMPIVPPQRPQPPTTSAVLTPDVVVIPGETPVEPSASSAFLGDTPTDSHWAGKRTYKPARDKLPPIVRTNIPQPALDIVGTFKRNLQSALEANPIPDYSPRPTA